MPSHYGGGYGKVASAMKRKQAMNKYGSPDNSRRKFHKFESGGGSQKVPPNVGVPPYKYGDSTSGEPQDRKAKRERPTSMQQRATPKNLGRPANEPTERGPTGPRSPMPEYQDSRNPVKREAMSAASGFRSFQSIIRGNVMGMRPPKKQPKSMRPVKGKGNDIGYT